MTDARRATTQLQAVGYPLRLLLWFLWWLGLSTLFGPPDLALIGMAAAASIEIADEIRIGSRR